MSINRRPESSIAQSFAADLDSMFGLSTGEVPVRSESGENTSSGRPEDIEQALNQKKQTLSSKAAELEELEARIKATEERLAKSRNASPARANLPQGQGQANVGAPFQQQQQSPTAQRTGHPLAQQPSYPSDRPATQRENTQALMSGMPGHLPPPTPAQEYAREEYVVVDGGAGGGYGRAVR
ncbi:hypothetical protein MBLNU13_g01375t1 [Cladosporium sp. NU13]